MTPDQRKDLLNMTHTPPKHASDDFNAWWSPPPLALASPASPRVVNRVTMQIIHTVREGSPFEAVIVQDFPEHGFTVGDVLAVTEAALRAAGFHCPHDSLIVDDDRTEEDPS